MRQPPYQIIWVVGFITALTVWSAGPCPAKTVTDQLGRTLTIPDDPARVISLAPNITEIIYFLGETPRLVGVTQYSNYPPAARRLPRVGSYVRLDLEKIVALQPDLCIASKDGNPKATVDYLEKLDIPVYAVDPRNLGMVMETVLEIGRLFNTEGHARNLVGHMRERVDQVRRQAAEAPTRPRVFFQIGVSPIVSAGTNSFIHELITVAGGINVSAGETVYPRYNREQVIALAPEVIIISSMARAVMFEQVKAEWQRWPSIPAVRDGRIHVVDSDIFDRASPRLVDGLEVLVKIIHPQTGGAQR
jgi:iron complex transport system substrate-binding protein